MIARLLCVLVMLAAEPAIAGGAIVYVGEVEQREREVISGAIAATAKQLGWSLTERNIAVEHRDALLACVKLDRPEQCAGRVLEQLGVDQLAIVELATERGEDGRPLRVITQHVVAPGVVLVARRICERCEPASLERHVGAMTARLIRDAASGSTQTVLEIRSTPSGAWITLDGDGAGATDATISTYPGTHTVMLRAAGYRPVIRDVVAVEGRAIELAVVLEPLAPAVEPRRGRRLPWVLLGAGLAALASGGALLALDEDPSPARGPTIRNTAPSGVAFAAAGVVTVAASLWWRF